MRVTDILNVRLANDKHQFIVVFTNSLINKDSGSVIISWGFKFSKLLKVEVKWSEVKYPSDEFQLEWYAQDIFEHSK